MSIESVMPSNHLILYPFCFQPFSASRSFPMSQLFTSDDQIIGASASSSVLPINIQGWFPWGLTCLISLLSKGLWRVFSSTTVQKHHFLGAQPFLRSNSHICTWLLETNKDSFDYAVGKQHSCLAMLLTFVGKLTSLLYKTLSRIIEFLPRSVF